MSRERSNARATETASEVQHSVQLIRLPLERPDRVSRWFALLELQFELARVHSDAAKYSAVVTNLGDQQLEVIDDILKNPPPTEWYENVKKELIRRLSDSDEARVQKLLEAQDMGDRIPSQFFRDMKKLATSSVSDSFLLTMWKNRLPATMRAILAPAKSKDPSELTEMADQIHEARLVINAASTSRPQGTKPPHGQQRQTTKESFVDQVMSLRKELASMKIEFRRRTNASYESRRAMLRSNSRSRSLQQQQHPDWCYYHQTFGARAGKCRAPCTWNQGNPSSRP
jgi:hypothetical protein